MKYWSMKEICEIYKISAKSLKAPKHVQNPLRSSERRNSEVTVNLISNCVLFQIIICYIPGFRYQKIWWQILDSQPYSKPEGTAGTVEKREDVNTHTNVGSLVDGFIAVEN